MTSATGKQVSGQLKGLGEILMENDDYVAVNKAAGALSIPDRMQSEPSLKDVLIEKYGKIFTVHRLDRETSGLIIFAKTEAAHQFYSKKFEDRSMEKYYLGLVHGSPAHSSASIDAAIMEHPVFKGQMVINKKGKPSLTDYEVQEDLGRYSLVKFRLHTGRTHQIRVHSKNIGNPIACDPLYGDGQPILLSSLKKKYKLSKQEEAERPIVNRVALHAYELKFTDADGNAVDLIAPLPKDITALLQQLRKLGK